MLAHVLEEAWEGCVVATRREEVEITRMDSGFSLRHKPEAEGYDEQDKYTTQHAFSTVEDLIVFIDNMWGPNNDPT